MTSDLLSYIGIFGGIIGTITGSWALFDRYRNRKPNILVSAPFHYVANNSVAGKIAFIFFRFSNTSKTPTYIYLETISVQLFYPDCNQWEKAEILTQVGSDVKTDFPPHMNAIMGINKARNLDKFDDTSIKYGIPLCGYLTFKIRSDKFSKLRGEVLDFRLKKIKFELDFDCIQRIN